MCCSVLQYTVFLASQCVAVCSRVLQCTVFLESQCVALCCSVLQCVAVCCSVLQCVAVCCSVQQSSKVCPLPNLQPQMPVELTFAKCNRLERRAKFTILKRTATHCNTDFWGWDKNYSIMRCVAVCCSVNALQCVAVCCSVDSLQCVAVC